MADGQKAVTVRADHRAGGVCGHRAMLESKCIWSWRIGRGATGVRAGWAEELGACRCVMVPSTLTTPGCSIMCWRCGSTVRASASRKLDVDRSRSGGPESADSKPEGSKNQAQRHTKMWRPNTAQTGRAPFCSGRLKGFLAAAAGTDSAPAKAW